MKTRFFVTIALVCFLGLANAVKADMIDLSTGTFDWTQGSIGAWATVFSDVEKEAYYHRVTGEGTVTNDGRTVTTRSYGDSGTDKVDTWDYRLSLMTDYLADTLGSKTMTTSGATGTLSTSSLSLVAHNEGNSYGESQNAYGNIYGKKAETLAGNWTTSNLIGAMSMYRNGSTLNNIITSSASPIDESVDHNWVYDAATDKFTSNALSTSNGIGDHNTGIFAFVRSFSYDDTAAFQFLNGWFSELGFLVGVFINGFELTPDYLLMSADFADSSMIRNHDMEIDLAKLYADGHLVNGNNNIAFVANSILPEYYGGNYYDGNDGLIAFASGLSLNTESIFPPPPGGETPEPATLLIFGIGLAGLGIGRRLMSKKSA